MTDVQVINTRSRERRKLHGRSRITNGDLLPGVDGRSLWGRRWRDLYEQIIASLSPPVSEWQRQEARRAVTLFVLCEQLEGRAAAGENIDPDQYGMMSDRLGRSFRRLGLKQSPGAPGPLGQILNNGLSK
jgi:hypothetical protein